MRPDSEYFCIILNNYSLENFLIILYYIENGFGELIMQIAICDDDPMIIKELQKILNNTFANIFYRAPQFRNLQAEKRF